MKNPKYYAPLFFTFLALPFVSSCRNKTDEKSDVPDTAYCKVVTVNSQELENKWYYVGEVEEGSNTAVSFSIPGMVRRVYVHEGDHVVKGQLLAELDPVDVMTSYNMAAASLNQANDAHRRLSVMHEEQSVADIKYVEVETKVEQAKTAFAAAQKRLNDTKLHSPVSGVIGRRSIEPGENVALGISAFNILNVNNLRVTVPVPEREIPNIAVGDRAQIKVLALGDDAIFNAHVSSINVASDPLTHSYTVSFDVANNGNLKPGMVCNVQMWPKSKAGQSGFIIPLSCVNVNTQSQHYVWLVRNGKATRQIVTISMFSKNGIKITDGLQDGDQVVVEGLEKISEGTVVRKVKSSQNAENTNL